MYNGSNCHTYDRDNWNAQVDCGLGASTAAADQNNWALATSSNFINTYWPFIQSPYTYNCLSQVMDVSYFSL